MSNVTKGNHHWFVKVANTKSDITKCIKIAAEYNDYSGIMKFRNFYYIMFTGAKDSINELKDEGFQIEKMEHFPLEKDDTVRKAVYHNDKKFTGFAMTMDEVNDLCRTVYTSPTFKRNQDVRFQDIDHIDDPNDPTAEMQKKTFFYLNSCIELMRALPDFVENQIITEKEFDDHYKILRERIDKLNTNMQLLNTHDEAKKPMLNPYIKWNQIVINKLQLTIVESRQNGKPSLKLKIEHLEI